jgi:hypothetical protein
MLVLSSLPRSIRCFRFSFSRNTVLPQARLLSRYPREFFGKVPGVKSLNRLSELKTDLAYVARCKDFEAGKILFGKICDDPAIVHKAAMYDMLLSLCSKKEHLEMAKIYAGASGSDIQAVVINCTVRKTSGR